MVKTQELGVGLDIVKHAAQKAFQVDSALHVEAHFWKEKYPYIVFTSMKLTHNSGKIYRFGLNWYMRISDSS
jgi:hypothetical protein